MHAGSNLVVDGGQITVDSAGTALYSAGTASVSGGMLSLKSGIACEADGIHCEKTLDVLAGHHHRPTAYEGLEALKLNISGGTISVVTSDDGLNASEPGLEDFVLAPNASINISAAPSRSTRATTASTPTARSPSPGE